MLKFDEVKRVTTIERVAAWLGLSGTRMQCPVNQGDKRELVIFTKTQSFCCYGCRKAGAHPSEYSGDLIQLAAHCKKTKVKEEAKEIMQTFHGYTPSKKGLPENGLDYLVAQHPEVNNLCLRLEVVEELGIGYAERGTMRRHILFPIRDKTGKLRGYLGWNPHQGTLKLPSDFLEK